MHDVNHGRLILPRVRGRIGVPNFLQELTRPLVVLEPGCSVSRCSPPFRCMFFHSLKRFLKADVEF